MGKDMGAVGWIAVILLIIGGLNWGIVGLLNLNVVEKILGSVPVLVQLVYILVGLSALWKIYVVAVKK